MDGNSARGRGLESYKKEAKRWLKAIEAGDVGALDRFQRAIADSSVNPNSLTLRDVQHALAREAGYAGWAALKDAAAARTTSATPTAVGLATLARYEDMADALLDAYRTGTPEAMERHYAHTWHRRPWSGMRSYVQLDLGKRPPEGTDDVEITLDDARKLIAAEHGFGDWDALRAFALALTNETTELAAKPVAVTAGGASERRIVQRSRDWSAVVATIAEHQATGIEAHGQATDAALKSLAQLTSIRELQLSNSRRVTDEGLRGLAPLTDLRHLDLSMTGVTDDGLAVVRNLPKLESINLAWTRVTDAGIAHLAACDRLERVNLAGTSTGDGAVRALTGKPQLSVLHTGALTTDASVAVLHDFPAFKKWNGGEADVSLMRFDVEANHLVLRGTISDAGLSALAGLDGLVSLNVDDETLRFSVNAVASLAGLPNLARLAIKAFDETMSAIVSLPRLRHLGVQDTVAGDAGFTALSKSQSIEAIWGRRCHNLRSAGFASLANMPALRALAVSSLNVDDAALASLPYFPALRELMPMDVADEGYRHIAKCVDLDRLTLMYCRDTGDRATEYVVRMPKLRRYFASYTRATNRTPELLARIDSLEEVELDGIPGITDAGVVALARLPRLREVKVSGQRVTPAVVDGFPAHVKVSWGM